MNNEDNILSLEELQILKEMIIKLDESSQVFKLSKDIIDINEKKLKKEFNHMKGDSEK